MPAYPGFCGGSYTSQSPLAHDERTVNFYVEPIEVQSGKTRVALYPSPGVQSFATATDGPGRGFFAYKGRAFAVIGATYYELLSNGSLTTIGAVASDNLPATLCTNGDGGGQIFITSGNNGYIHDLTTNVFSKVRTGATRMGAHLDGYFLAFDAETSTLFVSDLLDGTTWDPTQFAQRSIRPDPWVSMVVRGRYIWLLGTETSEVWYNAGTFPFPFAPHPSGLVEYGCAAPFSVHVVAGSLAWVASTAEGTAQVVLAAGFSPQVISTYALSVALSKLATIADAIGGAEQELGHTFYVLTLPTGNATVVYDTTTGLWCDRGTWISELGRYDAWRPLYHIRAFDKHLMLDRASGSIWELSATFGSDVDGRPIRRLRRPPGLPPKGERRFVAWLSLDVETGLGLSTGQGSNPLVALRISRDGGKTFGNERTRSAGALGDYDAEVRWARCGSAKRGQSWVPEFVMTDPIPWRISGANYGDAG